MARRTKHWRQLPKLIYRYADSRKFEVKQFDTWHYRIIDEGYAVVDIWTSRKYHIVKTSNRKITTKYITERTNERGVVPHNKKELGRFLDRIFYSADILEQSH